MNPMMKRILTFGLILLVGGTPFIGAQGPIVRYTNDYDENAGTLPIPIEIAQPSRNWLCRVDPQNCLLGTYCSGYVRRWDDTVIGVMHEHQASQKSTCYPTAPSQLITTAAFKAYQHYSYRQIVPSNSQDPTSVEIGKVHNAGYNVFGGNTDIIGNTLILNGIISGVDHNKPINHDFGTEMWFDGTLRDCPVGATCSGVSRCTTPISQRTFKHCVADAWF